MLHEDGVVRLDVSLDGSRATNAEQYAEQIDCVFKHTFLFYVCKFKSLTLQANLPRSASFCGKPPIENTTDLSS